jgi:hypothetical protein
MSRRRGGSDVVAQRPADSATACGPAGRYLPLVRSLLTMLTPTPGSAGRPCRPALLARGLDGPERNHPTPSSALRRGHRDIRRLPIRPTRPAPLRTQSRQLRRRRQTSCTALAVTVPRRRQHRTVIATRSTRTGRPPPASRLRPGASSDDERARRAKVRGLASPRSDREPRTFARPSCPRLSRQAAALRD